MTDLEEKLNEIKDEKETKIIPENIKKDVQIFDITGTYEAGGITPTGTINITQNGTTDVTDYATANVNVQPNLQNKQVSITTNTTTTVTPDTGKDGLSSVEITTNVSGGGGAEEKDVNFYDYDGTLLHSYTKTEFLALTEMPENPTHTGLTAQGWNWDLADAKTHVTDYDELDIGQLYTTASGLNEFDIELNNLTGLTVTLNMNGTKNWGDGTSDNLTTHTYSSAGKYTITCDGTTTSTSSSSGLFGQSSGNRNYSLLSARLAELTGMNKQIFLYCKSLNTVIMSKDVGVQGAFCNYCSSLKFIVFNKNGSIGSNMFQGSYNLQKIILGKEYSSSTSSFASCSSLKIPTTLMTSFDGNSFQSCYFFNKKLKFRNVLSGIYSNSLTGIDYPTILDFTKSTNVPSLLATNAFSNINKLTKIVVPDSLYSTWIAESNWTTYADYIIKESDYNAS